LKYQDPKLQREFELFQHESFPRLGRVIVVGILLLNIVDSVFGIYCYNMGDIEKRQLIAILLISSLC